MSLRLVVRSAGEGAVFLHVDVYEADGQISENPIRQYLAR